MYGPDSSCVLGDQLNTPLLRCHPDRLTGTSKNNVSSSRMPRACASDQPSVLVGPSAVCLYVSEDGRCFFAVEAPAARILSVGRPLICKGRKGCFESALMMMIMITIMCFVTISIISCVITSISSIRMSIIHVVLELVLLLIIYSKGLKVRNSSPYAEHRICYYDILADYILS